MPQRVFSPAAIGPVRLANRLVRTATLECMCPTPGIVGDRYLSLYENLARGGAGLIVTGNFFVHRLGIVQANNLLIDSDEVIPQLRKIAAVVRRHNVPIFGQINHGGRYAREPLTGAKPLAPSAVKDTINRVTPQAMTEEQIETAIASFVSASRRLRDAGFDGVEINATHGYLANQFLSGFANRRNDRWGGTQESRFLFLSEIVTRTCAVVGPGFPVTVKLSGSDFMPRGITLEECVFFSRRLESVGASGLTISGGFKEKAFRTMSKGDIPRQLVLSNRRGFERLLGIALLAAMRRSARFSEGYFLPHAAAVKAAVSIPVNCNRCTVMTALLSEPLRCHWKKESEPEEESTATADGFAANGLSAGRLQTSDGLALFYRTAIPERPRGAVFFLHGMSEHSGMYLHVIRALADAGLIVVAPDQRGRGRSVNDRWRRGDLHSVDRVLEDLDELRQRLRVDLDGLPVFIIGISMGSIIAQAYARQRQASLAGIVLVGPPFGVPERVARPLLAVSGLIAAAAPRLAMRPAPPVPHISRVRAFQNELDWDPWCYHGPLRARAGHQLVKALSEIEHHISELSLPLLLLYGSEDKIVSLREVQENHRRWGGKDRTLTIMKGLYHDVLNEPERQEAIDSIISWIAARLGG
jgi:2,4-dienoyl-CoA reductase-like NADH-dependent reductase (Old Yellow Enzyme family)/alpha-beta hydrolase superfamily lysophospholipase